MVLPEAGSPGPLVVHIHGDGQGVVLVAHGQPGLVVLVAELHLAATYQRSSAILVVVVGDGAVVHHGSKVGVAVLVGRHVVTVRVR